MTDTVTGPDDRPEPPRVADELATLVGFLEFLRATFAWRVSGLDDEQLHRTLHPTTMTLGAMVKHLAFVEDYWFTCCLGGRAPVEPFRSADWGADPDWDWHSAASDTGDELRALWQGCVERSRAQLAESAASADGLGVTFVRRSRDERLSLRWLMTHMIEEYARHCGHADLLREAIDGQTGE